MTTNEATHPQATPETRVSGERLARLVELGQRAWLDYIERRLVRSGELARLIAELHVSGLTSNPTIFEQAIAGTDQYDEDIRRLAARGATAGEIYETLVLEDLGAAADLFLPTYEASGGRDGFVSLEVSPRLAHDAEGTVAEAQRLWAALGRRNVMLKVPGTEAGLEALRRLIAAGVNVNVTLLFSLERYREVAGAYIDGLEQAAAAGRPLDSIASVASFFLSRIDTAVDPRLETLIAEQGPRREEAKALRGEVAIASAKRAYAIYRDVFGGKRFARLAAQGARPQWLLWASTSTKDPRESDVKYVDALIGPETINTMPQQTLLAFADHGDPAPRLTEGADRAAAMLKALNSLGVSLEEITQRLETDGIARFVKSFDTLHEAIERKRAAVAAAAAG
ncbi:MAG TPA: transaldolase [Gammaproteobacteria bacterium]